MTTISAPHTGAIPTASGFERALLRTAAALDLYVAQRLERRAGIAGRRAADAQTAAVAARGEAQALGAIGILPR